MKTFLLLVIGFAVLAVTLAPPPTQQTKDQTAPTQENGTQDEQSEGNEEDDEELEEEQPPEPPKPKPTPKKKETTRPAPTRKGSRAKPSSQKNRAAEITIKIPMPDAITNKLDPVSLGKKIAAANENNKEKLTEELEKLVEENEGNIQGAFYEAALTAIDSPIEARKKYRKELDSYIQIAKDMVEDTPDSDILSSERFLLSDLDEVLTKELPVTIPKPGSITAHCSPAALGQKIANLSDEEREEQMNQLSKLAKQNKNTVQGKFYENVLKAIENPTKVLDQWKKDIQSFRNNTASKVDEFQMEDLFDDFTPFAYIQELITADPVGTTAKGVDSIGLRAASNGFRAASDLSNLGHNLAEITATTGQALTSGLDYLPFIGPFKRNFDNALLDRIRDGRTATNKILGAASDAFGELANKRKGEYEQGLRQMRSLSNRRR